MPLKPNFIFLFLFALLQLFSLEGHSQKLDYEKVNGYYFNYPLANMPSNAKTYSIKFKTQSNSDDIIYPFSNFIYTKDHAIADLTVSIEINRLFATESKIAEREVTKDKKKTIYYYYEYTMKGKYGYSIKNNSEDEIIYTNYLSEFSFYTPDYESKESLISQWGSNPQDYAYAEVMKIIAKQLKNKFSFHKEDVVFRIASLKKAPSSLDSINLAMKSIGIEIAKLHENNSNIPISNLKLENNLNYLSNIINCHLNKTKMLICEEGVVDAIIANITFGYLALGDYEKTNIFNQIYEKRHPTWFDSVLGVKKKLTDQNNALANAVNKLFNNKILVNDIVRDNLKEYRSYLEFIAESNKKLINVERSITSKQPIQELEIDITPEVVMKKYALVVGVANYYSIPALNNTINDARAMIKVLKGMGYSVDSIFNPTSQRLTDGLDSWQLKLKKDCSEALFYYAGHGVSFENVNYLVPICKRIDYSSGAQIENNFKGIHQVLNVMAEAKVPKQIAIIDACRSEIIDPSFKGFGKINYAINGSQSLGIIYSTGSGSKAFDGPKGGNGIFTKAVLKHIVKPDISFSNVVAAIISEVTYETNGMQIPQDVQVSMTKYVFNKTKKK